MTDKEVARLREIVQDGKKCARLTLWETDFVASLAGKLDRYGNRIILTESQMEAVDRIEGKVYST